MKLAIIVPDGMADRPEEMGGGPTPLEAASTPEMDSLARGGVLGRVVTVPEDVAPGSAAAIMSVLGADPREHRIGRAALEAAGRGIELAADEVVFRANLVTLERGRLADYSAGGITTAEAKPLVDSLRGALAPLGAALHLGVGYRHLLVLEDREGRLDDVESTPPHDIQGEILEPYVPQASGANVVRLLDIMFKASEVLASHPVNEERKAAGRRPANALWLWGQGRRAELPSLKERFGVSGSVISAVDLVRGIGRLMGMAVIEVEGATGDIDTNFAGKGEAAANALDAYDIVFVHVEAPDEASHRGEAEEKRRAIESVDTEVVSRVRRKAEERGDVRVLVLPDHLTPLSIRTHAHGAVPFALWGPGVRPKGGDALSERAAETADTYIERGPELLAFALGGMESN